MKTRINLLLAGMFLAATSSALATVRYVNVNNANPTPPYTNWATAATNIQDAVDAAGAGDQIVVTNGTYFALSWGDSPVDPNGGHRCVVVRQPLTVQSVNGPSVTVINGGGVVGCLYLTNDAVMVGFTLTNGFTYGDGGGVYCESTNAALSNCVLSGNSAHHYYGFGGYGGGAYGGTLNNCTLARNLATGDWSDTNPVRYYPGVGGGAYSCTLNNCTLTGNSADYGGGACDCALNNCTLTGNSVSGGSGAIGSSGGGAYNCMLNNCTLTGNLADSGGGAFDSTLNNCTLRGNSANYGGAACYGTLNNCVLTGNRLGTAAGRLATVSRLAH